MDVFYVEDNPADVRLLQAAFRIAKFNPLMTVTEDGLRAIEAIEDLNKQGKPMPLLILLDLNLPKVNGYEVLKHLKSHKDFSAIPIIVFTGSNNPDDQAKCFSLNADDYWTKPQDLQEALSIANNLKSFLKEPSKALSKWKQNKGTQGLVGGPL
jgi:CheY-like chemotaxis protein